MARPRKYVIKLTEDEYKELKSIIRKMSSRKIKFLSPAQKQRIIISVP